MTSGDQITNVRGISLSYRARGSGPLVVVIGGLGMDAATMDRTYGEAFCNSGFSVLLLNPRGIPPSDSPPGPYTVHDLVEDSAALLRSLNVRDCFLVGFSLGALVVQELVLAYPDGKIAAALVATVGRISKWTEILTTSEIALYASATSPPTDYIIASDLLQTYTIDELADDDRVIRIVKAMRQRNNARTGRIGLMSAIASYGNRLEQLGTIRVPSLVISFRNDALTPAVLGQELGRRIRGSRLAVIEDAAHHGIFSRRAEVQKEILGFFGALRDKEAEQPHLAV